jgi:hypothetical protein
MVVTVFAGHTSPIVHPTSPRSVVRTGRIIVACLFCHDASVHLCAARFGLSPIHIKCNLAKYFIFIRFEFSFSCGNIEFIERERERERRYKDISIPVAVWLLQIKRTTTTLLKKH